MAYKRFGPVWTPQSHTLIVGTWPSPESRRQNFYYGHPRNRFWPLLAALLGTAVPCTVEEKKRLRGGRNAKIRHVSARGVVQAGVGDPRLPLPGAHPYGCCYFVRFA